MLPSSNGRRTGAFFKIRIFFPTLSRKVRTHEQFANETNHPSHRSNNEPHHGGRRQRTMMGTGRSGNNNKRLASYCFSMTMMIVAVLRRGRGAAFSPISRAAPAAAAAAAGSGSGALGLSLSSSSASYRDDGPDNRRHARCCRIAVIGGGASGIFAAIAAAAAADPAGAAADSASSVHVTVLEASSKTLQKVKVSGGGRCNVLHDANLPLRDYVAAYPRGSKQLPGLFAAPATESSSTTTKTAAAHRFGPIQARQWFESRGVALKTEKDGRMFPTTDSSQTVVDCLLREGRSRGVEILTRTKVVGVRYCDGGESGGGKETATTSGSPFLVDVVEREGESQGNDEENDNSRPLRSAQTLEFDAIILATGSAPAGHHIASSLGHPLVSPVPSLFTLSTRRDVAEGGLLCGLAGVSLAHARVSFEVKEEAAATAEPSPSSPASTNAGKRKKKPKRLEQEGPMLVTHHGLSGPAALRLSAFGAVELHRLKYQTQLNVHWAPTFGSENDVFEELWKQTSLQPKKLVRTVCPLMLTDGVTSCEADDFTEDNKGTGTGSAIPKRLWSALVSASGLSDKAWAEASKKEVRDLARRIAETELAMTGKGTFKEEFVTAGGIDLNQVHTRTMQSKIVPGLFVCGECLNVDGVTGGFNFMNAWYACS
jgi:predicted flavoprotein YhiN